MTMLQQPSLPPRVRGATQVPRRTTVARATGRKQVPMVSPARAPPNPAVVSFYGRLASPEEFLTSKGIGIQRPQEALASAVSSEEQVHQSLSAPASSNSAMRTAASQVQAVTVASTNGHQSSQASYSIPTTNSSAVQFVISPAPRLGEEPIVVKDFADGFIKISNNAEFPQPLLGGACLVTVGDTIYVDLRLRIAGKKVLDEQLYTSDKFTQEGCKVVFQSYPPGPGSKVWTLHFQLPFYGRQFLDALDGRLRNRTPPAQMGSLSLTNKQDELVDVSDEPVTESEAVSELYELIEPEVTARHEMFLMMTDDISITEWLNQLNILYAAEGSILDRILSVEQPPQLANYSPGMLAMCRGMLTSFFSGSEIFISFSPELKAEFLDVASVKVLEKALTARDKQETLLGEARSRVVGGFRDPEVKLKGIQKSEWNDQAGDAALRFTHTSTHSTAASPLTKSSQQPRTPSSYGIEELLGLRRFAIVIDRKLLTYEDIRGRAEPQSCTIIKSTGDDHPIMAGRDLTQISTSNSSASTLADVSTDILVRLLPNAASSSLLTLLTGPPLPVPADGQAIDSATTDDLKLTLHAAGTPIPLGEGSNMTAGSTQNDDIFGVLTSDFELERQKASVPRVESAPSDTSSDGEETVKAGTASREAFTKTVNVTTSVMHSPGHRATTSLDSDIIMNQLESWTLNENKTPTASKGGISATASPVHLTWATVPPIRQIWGSSQVQKIITPAATTVDQVPSDNKPAATPNPKEVNPTQSLGLGNVYVFNSAPRAVKAETTVKSRPTGLSASMWSSDGPDLHQDPCPTSASNGPGVLADVSQYGAVNQDDLRQRPAAIHALTESTQHAIHLQTQVGSPLQTNGHQPQTAGNSPTPHYPMVSPYSAALSQPPIHAPVGATQPVLQTVWVPHPTTGELVAMQGYFTPQHAFPSLSGFAARQENVALSATSTQVSHPFTGYVSSTQQPSSPFIPGTGAYKTAFTNAGNYSSSAARPPLFPVRRDNANVGAQGHPSYFQ
jgi:hypothetical protein